MTETPKCPYCGAEMKFNAIRLTQHRWVGGYHCENCRSVGPRKSNCYTEKEAEESALSAALHRAEPENHPLTLEEIIAELENKELHVVWVECKVLMAAVPMFPSHRHGDTAFFFAPLTRRACTETLSNYGKTWRCWPRKPTPKQMAAEKWEVNHGR